MHKLNHRLDTINKLRYRFEKINQNADSRRKKKNKEMEYRTGKLKEGRINKENPEYIQKQGPEKMR